jgi:predicted nucleotidyltransferase
MINNNEVRLINSSFMKYAPKKIALLGSKARGDENAGSDLDILVSFPGMEKAHIPLLELLSLEKSLDCQFGFPIEIVNENSNKNDVLKQHISSYKVIVYEQTDSVL